MKSTRVFLMGMLSAISVLMLASCNGVVYGHGGGDRGGGDRGGDHGGNGGGDRHGPYGNRFYVGNSASAVTPEASAQLMANDYGVSVQSATIILTGLRGGLDFQALAKLDITPQDVDSLMSMDAPSDDLVNRMANSLHENATSIRNIISDVYQDTMTH